MGGVDFEAIYGAYFSDVYFYMLHLCRDAHVAEELTSETFFRALRAIGKFRGDCDIRVWLCRIARNCYAAHQKRAARVSAAGDDALEALPAKGPPVAEQVAARDTAERLQALLHTLPDPYKEVFLWRVYGELSFRQIGQLFEKTENWACVTYHRARAMLQQRWEDCDHDA